MYVGIHVKINLWLPMFQIYCSSLDHIYLYFSSCRTSWTRLQYRECRDVQYHITIKQYDWIFQNMTNKIHTIANIILTAAHRYMHSHTFGHQISLQTEAWSFTDQWPYAKSIDLLYVTHSHSLSELFIQISKRLTFWLLNYLFGWYLRAHAKKIYWNSGKARLV